MQNNFSIDDLKGFLDEKYDQYNRPSFIDTDPIQIPHEFSKKEDIEIAAFLTSVIAWGKRAMIIRNAKNMMNFLKESPYEFIINSSDQDFNSAENIGHRTFMNIDFIYFLKSLKNIYTKHGGLERVFYRGYSKNNDIFDAISYFRDVFFELKHEKRTEKHIANVLKNSAAKRINMFLMWMVRNDNRGVHFGLWNKIPTSKLMLPLDVHVGNTARAVGLLTRKQNDKKSVIEITDNLKQFDENDPVKYDFALFSLGVFEKFGKIKS